MKKIVMLVAVLGFAAALSASAADAKENWTTTCAKCHGAEGKGDTKIGAHSVIGSNVWIMQSVPPESAAYFKSDQLVIRPRHTNGRPGSPAGDMEFSWDI